MSPEQSNPPPPAPVPPYSYGRPIAAAAVKTIESARVDDGVWRLGAGSEPSLGRADWVSGSGAGRGAVGGELPPRCRVIPRPSSNPCRWPRDSSRQRPSIPTDRNDAGNTSYPTPADQDPHPSERSLEVWEPSPPLRPAMR